MTFTKPMIDLIREIRKHVPADDKPGIKLANPDVIDEIIALYHNSKNTIFRVLTRELCTLAGEEYLSQLDPVPPETKEKIQEPGPREINITRVYRGQVQVIKKTIEEAKPEMVNHSPRVYRGVVQE